MLKKLPREHPPIKGCVNLFSIRELMAVDFSEWASDADDQIVTIDYIASLNDDDIDFAKQMHELTERLPKKISSASYLPVRVQQWFNDTPLMGIWLYDVRLITVDDLSSTRSKWCYRMCFQYTEDALMFKLRWHGETNE
jgi:hypothetical protein